MSKYYPATPNSFAQGAKEVNIPLQMDPKYRDIGAKTKIVRRRTTVKSTNTEGPKKFYSFRAFMTKENVEPTPLNPITGLKDILESEDMSELPQDIINDIKSLMRKGVNPGKKDLEAYQQTHGTAELPQWKNALELLDTAYHNANIEKPPINSKGWKQYLDLIPVAVKLLADKYGLQGDTAKWRITQPIVTENDQVNERMERDTLLQQLLPKEKKDEEPTNDNPQSLNDLEAPDDYEPSHIGKKRFFVSIAGSGQTEVDAKNLDDIIEQMHNKMRRHGIKVRVEERSKDGAVLTFWYKDIKRERIIIRQVG